MNFRVARPLARSDGGRQAPVPEEGKPGDRRHRKPKEKPRRGCHRAGSREELQQKGYTMPDFANLTWALVVVPTLLAGSFGIALCVAGAKLGGPR